MNIVLYPPLSQNAFHIFNLTVRWYGIILSFAIFAGIVLSALLIKKFISHKDYELYLDIMPVVVISAILGARIFYVLGNFSYYLTSPNEIFLINHGGVSIYGAIIFGLLAIYLYSKKYKFNLPKYLDIIALTMPLCQSIGRWGNFFNQEAYGAAYNGFLKMYISEQFRYPQYKNIEFYHPAFLYESILDLILFFILFFIFFKFKNIKSGSILYLYLILYASIRIIVESIRIDSTLYIANIPVATLISIIIFFISFSLLLVKSIKNN